LSKLTFHKSVLEINEPVETIPKCPISKGCPAGKMAPIFNRINSLPLKWLPCATHIIVVLKDFRDMAQLFFAAYPTVLDASSITMHIFQSVKPINHYVDGVVPINTCVNETVSWYKEL
jgi:hypothetical protein